MFRFDITNTPIFIALFIIPGLIMSEMYYLHYPGEKDKASSRILSCLTYSSFNYALWSWVFVLWPIQCFIDEKPGIGAFYIVSVLLISPLLLGFSWIKARKTDFIASFAPLPVATAWDHIFRQRQSLWVIVKLKNNEVIAGKFEKKSYASSRNNINQLYIEEEWRYTPDEGFIEKEFNSKGVLILATDIHTIHFKEDSA